MKLIRKILLCTLVLLATAATQYALMGTSQLSHVNINGDGYADLAVGVPDEDVSTSGDIQITRVDTGAVKTSASPLSGAGDQFWHQNSSRVDDAIEDDDHFSGMVLEWACGLRGLEPGLAT